MPFASKGPPRGDAASPIDLAFPGGNDLRASPNQALSQEEISGATKRAPNPAVAAVIKDLNAEYAAEAARIASIYAVHFVEDMEIGDHWAAEHDMRGAVLHLREAAAKFREWQRKPLPARRDVA